MEADEDGVTAKNTYGGPLLFRTEFDDSGETTYQYMYNAHGDVVTLLSDGEVEATYYYDAFGNILEQTGEVDNSILYAGYQYDEETGLYYLNARMYDPVTARFIQADTYLGNLNDPLSLNLYTYCLNNPHKYVDPSGHFAITLAVVASALIWGIAGAAVEYMIQKKAGGMIDYDKILFQGVLNAGIAILSGGLANGAVAAAQGARMTAQTFGRMLLAEAGLGIAEGIISETGYQLLSGTKVKDLDAGRIASSGVMGGLSGVGGALVGEGISAGLKALKNSRVVNKVTGQIGKYANALKESSAGKRFRQMDLQFFAGDEVYKSGSTTNKIDYKEVFFEEYPELRGEVWVHHGVEQQILTKPQTRGLFSYKEMHSLDNLRGIPKEINSDLHLSKIRKEWNKFYKEFPNPTKEQLLQKRLDIDKKYGHLFKPPIDVE